MHYQRLLFFKITTLNFLLRQWKGWHVLAALLVLGTIPYFSDGNDRDLRKSYTSVRISHWKYLVFDFNFWKPTFITCMKCCCLVFQTKTLGSLWIYYQKLLPCVFFFFCGGRGRLALFKLKAESPISIQIIYPISAFVLSLFSNKKWPQSCQFATYRRNGLFEFSTSQTGQMAFPIFKVIMSELCIPLTH